MKGPAPSGALPMAGRVLLCVSVSVAAFYFVSKWAINARGLGAHDAGLALFLSFANVLTLYACIGLTAAGGLLTMAGALLRRDPRAFLWSMVVSALPVAYAALFR